MNFIKTSTTIRSSVEQLVLLPIYCLAYLIAFFLTIDLLLLSSAERSTLQLKTSLLVS